MEFLILACPGGRKATSLARCFSTPDKLFYQKEKGGMGEIQIFSFQNCEVRVIEGENGEPWFVAKDVAEILGYSETAKMLRRLDEDECKKIEPDRKSVV